MLTVIGDDRAGLVEALSSAVSAHGGNWENSQLAELAGKFAGIVVVTVPAERAEDLTDALGGLVGLLDVSAHPGSEGAEPPQAAEDAPRLTIDIIGNDHAGIVHDVSSVLARHDLSIETIATESRDAPMAGGRLFEAHIVARVPAGAEPAAVRADLERLATELLVDLEVSEPLLQS